MSFKICALYGCNLPTETPRHKFCCYGHKWHFNNAKTDAPGKQWGSKNSQTRLDKSGRRAAKRQKKAIPPLTTKKNLFYTMISTSQSLELLNGDQFPIPYMTGYAYEKDAVLQGRTGKLSVSAGERYDAQRAKSAGLTFDDVRASLVVGAFETGCSRLKCSFFLIQETKEAFSRYPSPQFHRPAHFEQMIGRGLRSDFAKPSVFMLSFELDEDYVRAVAKRMGDIFDKKD